jgi:AcrR family transcriptional regulator
MTPHTEPGGGGEARSATGEEARDGKAPRRRHASRNDYITLFLRLGAEGYDLPAISVDELLEHMPVRVTRGSFYNHFANTGDFYSAVIARWREETSSDAIEAAMSGAMRVVGDPSKRLQVLREWARGTAARDRAVRLWAARAGLKVIVRKGPWAAADVAKAAAAEDAKAAVDDADAAIIGYTRLTLRSLGYGNADAQAWASLMIGAFTGDLITDEEFRRLLRWLRRGAPQRRATGEVGVTAADDGALVLYGAGAGEGEQGAELARQFAAGQDRAAAGQDPDDDGGGPGRRGRRARAPSG